jgi:hypothetical protein
MKKSKIDPKDFYRYDKEKNTIYIDIKIDYYKEIYNIWDFSPLYRRDLDDDLYDYLESCVKDIPKKYHLCIVFHVHEKIRDEEKEKNSITGYKNYFQYQIKKLNQRIRGMKQKMLVYFGFGLLFIFFGNLLYLNIDEKNIFYFLIEGLFIGGWVLFWELFSIIFFKFKNFRDEKKLLNRLKDSQIIYSYTNQ